MNEHMSNGRLYAKEDRSARRYERLLELMEEGVPLCDVCKDQV